MYLVVVIKWFVFISFITWYTNKLNIWFPTDTPYLTKASAFTINLSWVPLVVLMLVIFFWPVYNMALEQIAEYLDPYFFDDNDNE